MKRDTLITLSVFLLSCIVLLSCEKDEKRAIMKAEIAPPELSVPSHDITLLRSKSSDTLYFTGNQVDYGFNSAETYTLQMSFPEDNFEHPITVGTKIGVDSFMVVVKDLNQLLLKNKVPEYTATPMLMRIKVSGSEYLPVAYSPVVNVNLKVFGLPKLIIATTPNTEAVQSIPSPGGDGVYSGYAKLQAGTFTLTDQDASLIYGLGSAEGKISAGGNPIPATLDGLTTGTPWEGWYIVDANTNLLTYKLSRYMVGMVGTATPNGNKPPAPPIGKGDNKMDYDANDNCWTVTLDLKAGWFKFRVNDDYGKGLNIGNQPGTPSGTNNLNKLANASNSANITFPIDASTPAGKYTVRLYLTANPIRCTLTPVQ